MRSHTGMDTENIPIGRRNFISLVIVSFYTVLSGCLFRDIEGNGRVQLASNIENKTVQVNIYNENEEQEFTNSATLQEGESVTWDSVISGHNGDEFLVKITKDGETTSTTWELTCVENNEKSDQFTIVVTGYDEVYTTNSCYVQ